MHAHLFLDALAPALGALEGLPVEMVAAISTLGSSDPSPWPPFRLAVVISTPIDVEIAADRLGFAREVDARGITVLAQGELGGMQLLIYSSWRANQGELP